MPFYVGKLGSKSTILDDNYIFEEDIIRLSVRNIKRVSRFSFWRTKCFEEAFALKLLLQRYHVKSTIYFGVKKGEANDLEAHSWLKISDKTLIGGLNSEDKYVVTQFFT